MVEKKLSEIRIRRSQYTEELLKMLWELDPTLKDKPTATFQRGIEALIREQKKLAAPLINPPPSKKPVQEFSPTSESPVGKPQETSTQLLNGFETDLLELPGMS
jgi:hypothetical protein